MSKYLLENNCNVSCPYNESCCRIQTEIVASDNNKVKVLFLGSSTNHDGNIAFTDWQGLVLRKMLDHYKFAKYGYGFTYIYRNNKKIPNLAKVKCFNLLYTELEKINPELILLVGDAVFNFYFPNNDLEKTVGQIFEITIQNKTYKAMFLSNLHYAKKTPEFLAHTVRDLHRAFGIRSTFINPNIKPIVLDDLDEIEAICNKMVQSNSPICIDTETVNLNRVYDNKLLTVQISNDGRNGYIIPYMHKDSPFSIPQLKQLKNILQKFITAKGNFKYWIGTNLKFDSAILYTHRGCMFRAPKADVMLAYYLLEENLLNLNDKQRNYSLATLAKEYGFFGYETDPTKEDRESIHKRDLISLKNYMAMDVCVPWQLWHIFLDEAKQQHYKRFKQMVFYFYSRQIELFTTLELNGVYCDFNWVRTLYSPKLSPINNELKKILADLYKSPYVKKANKLLTNQWVGTSRPLFGDSPLVFDINKPQHRHLLFFDVMKLDPITFGKDKEGEKTPSCDKTFQKEYSDVKEVQLYTAYNKTNKLRTSFVNKVYNYLKPGSEYADCKDRRLRPNFSSMGTVTGRASCSNPNLQQDIQRGSELVKLVKRMYIAPPNRLLVNLDFSANEVRSWGILSGDPKLIKLFRDMHEIKEEFRRNPTEENRKRAKYEADPHIKNASFFNNIPPEEVTPEMRQDFKSVIFGAIYDRTPGSIAKQLGKEYEETLEIYNGFFAMYPQGAAWLQFHKEEARRKGYVESPLGRRRRLYHYFLNDEWISIRADRRAVNSPIQGFASDLTFIGASILLRWMCKNGKYNIWDSEAVPDDKKWKLNNVVHDSLKAEIPVSDLKEYILVTEKCMTTGVVKYVKRYFNFEIKVPLEVDFEVGFSADALFKWDGTRQHLDELVKQARSGSFKKS